MRYTRDSLRLSFVNVVLKGSDIFIVLLAWRPWLGLEETVDDALYDQGMIFKSCPLVLFKCSWCRRDYNRGQEQPQQRTVHGQLVVLQMALW